MFVFLLSLVLAGESASLQGKPLERTFVPGATYRYRVELVVRSELEGQRAVPVGVKSYSEPFVRFAEARISWVATQRVVSVDGEGTAEIDRKSTRLNSSHIQKSRMPSSA